MEKIARAQFALLPAVLVTNVLKRHETQTVTQDQSVTLKTMTKTVKILPQDEIVSQESRLPIDVITASSFSRIHDHTE